MMQFHKAEGSFVPRHMPTYQKFTSKQGKADARRTYSKARQCKAKTKCSTKFKQKCI